MIVTLTHLNLNIAVKVYTLPIFRAKIHAENYAPHF